MSRTTRPGSDGAAPDGAVSGGAVSGGAVSDGTGRGEQDHTRAGAPGSEVSDGGVRVATFDLDPPEESAAAVLADLGSLSDPSVDAVPETEDTLADVRSGKATGGRGARSPGGPLQPVADDAPAPVADLAGAAASAGGAAPVAGLEQVEPVAPPHVPTADLDRPVSRRRASGGRKAAAPRVPRAAAPTAAAPRAAAPTAGRIPVPGPNPSLDELRGVLQSLEQGGGPAPAERADDRPRIVTPYTELPPRTRRRASADRDRRGRSAGPSAGPGADDPGFGHTGEDGTDDPGFGHTGEDGRSGRPQRRIGPKPIDLDADPVAQAKEICLRLLTDRARTRQELAKELRRREVPEEAIGEVLDRFDEVGLIDDAAFAAQWVRSRQRSRGLARRAIAYELRRKGVDDEIAGEALAEVDGDSEERRARELVQLKARSMASGTPEERAKAMRRLVGMLARKGYGGGLAYRVVREVLAAKGAEEDELGTEPVDD